MTKGKKLDFLLGAVSPMGFTGYFNQVTGTNFKHSVLIKAGPGCGKSTMMKKIANHLTEKGHDVWLVHCSSDPSSLDGVICPDIGFCIVDSTAPHTLEPRYPVACEEVLSLYHLLDESKIKEKRLEIIELYNKCASLHERATRYITAAGALISDTARSCVQCTDYNKVNIFAQKLAQKYIPRTDTNSSEKNLLISASTCLGQVFYIDTIKELTEQNIIILDDDYGCASKVILKQLRDDALSKGHNIITCYCPLSPHEKIEHLFIPSLGLGFCTSNSFHPISIEGKRVVHCTRFMDESVLKNRRTRLKFNKKASVELLSEASAIQREAKLTHDLLEACYIKAVDFSKLDVLCDDLIKRI